MPKKDSDKRQHNTGRDSRGSIKNLYHPTFADTVNVNPSSRYEYAVYTTDCHDNWSAPQYFSVVTAPAGSGDARLTGLRPTGVYWGALGEQIDMLSGNLNFTIPLIKAEARTGWGVTFGLNYNSQMWRADANWSVWKYGEDVGYGFGWKLLAGRSLPVFRNVHGEPLHLHR